MILLKKKHREMVLQLLFSFEMGCHNEEELIVFFMHELSISRKHVREAYQKAQTIWERHQLLDQKIAPVSSNWVIEPVERNILRLALFEILMEQEIPPQVTITEAIRLCRKFSTPQVGGFVNAILDAYCPKKTETVYDEQSTFHISESEAAQ